MSAAITDMALIRRLRAAGAAHNRARAARDAVIREAAASMSQRQIAKAVGLTHQRVQQILANDERDAE